MGVHRYRGTSGEDQLQATGVVELLSHRAGSKAYRAVDRHTADRLRQWLCRKHKVQGAGTTRYPYRYLYEKLNLVRLEGRQRNVTWAKA